MLLTELGQAGFSNIDYYLVDDAGHVTLSKDVPV